MSNLDLKNIITTENSEAVNIAVNVVKQDVALQTAIDSLNTLVHVNSVEFQYFGREYGVDAELKNEIYSLLDKLKLAKFGKF